jgi:hypothetical protein
MWAFVMTLSSSVLNSAISSRRFEAKLHWKFRKKALPQRRRNAKGITVSRIFLNSGVNFCISAMLFYQAS